MDATRSATFLRKRMNAMLHVQNKKFFIRLNKVNITIFEEKLLKC
jgi:hypothetical protein